VPHQLQAGHDQAGEIVPPASIVLGELTSCTDLQLGQISEASPPA
jgi:hypothetical protein